MRRSALAIAAAFIAAAFIAAAFIAAAGPPPFGLGTPATPAEIAGWNIDISPDGAGLPPGQGSVAEGAAIFAATCAACHGAKGEGGPQERLVGGQGTLRSAKPIKTVGSYWPYATTLFDYIRRAMPLDHPQSLGADQVYALCAYILHLNGIVPEAAVLDAATLPKVAMPNRNGFIRTEPEPAAP
jgi:S-disulfanyl-L-cysteine oxidoreductase SoxD